MQEPVRLVCFFNGHNINKAYYEAIQSGEAVK